MSHADPKHDRGGIHTCQIDGRLAIGIGRSPHAVIQCGPFWSRSETEGLATCGANDSNTRRADQHRRYVVAVSVV